MTDPAPSTPAADGSPTFVPATPEPELVTEPVVPGAVKPGTSRPRGSMWVNVALAVALAVAIGGVGFAAGRMTAPASTAGSGTGRFGTGTFPGGNLPGGGYFGDNGGTGGGGFGGRGFFTGGGASITGTVESISGDTLTLKLAGGQTIQVSLSGTTTYHAQSAATSSDVKTGGTVIVRVDINRGESAGTGSTSASDVTIVP